MITLEPNEQPIDYEIRELIEYMNRVDGIRSVNSCCGHGEMPCQIWFKADNIECVTRFIHKYLYCNPNWRIVLSVTDAEIDSNEWDNPTYLLETTLLDYQYVGLAIDNLTYSFRERLGA